MSLKNKHALMVCASVALLALGVAFYHLLNYQNWNQPLGTTSSFWLMKMGAWPFAFLFALGWMVLNFLNTALELF